jgi:hypothetical protein
VSKGVEQQLVGLGNKIEMEAVAVTTAVVYIECATALTTIVVTPTAVVDDAPMLQLCS